MSNAFILVTVVILATAAAAIVVAAISARRMSERLGQFVEGHVKPKFFPARHLDLLALQRRIVVAALTGVTVSVAGERYMARHLRIQVSPRDHWRLSNNLDGGLERVAADLTTEIGRRAVKLGYTVPSEMRVEILVSAFVVDGRPVRAGAVSQPSPAAKPDGVARSSDPAKSAGQVKPAGPVKSVEPAVAATPESAPQLGTRLASTRRLQADDNATVNMDGASLQPDDGGSPIRLVGRRSTVGRKEAGHRCDVAIDHPSVSSAHAEVRCSRGAWSVADGHSTNGTYVNGEQVRDSVLADGDRVQFSSDGPTFVFRVQRGPEVCGAQAPTRRSI